MKKILIFIIMIFVVMMTSCDDQTTGTYNEIKETQTPTATPELVTPSGTYLFGMNISNQPYLVVKSMVSDKSDELKKDSFTVKGNNNTYKISYSDIGYELQVNEIVKNIKNSKNDNVAFVFDEQKLKDSIVAIIETENVVPENATVKMENKELVVIDGKSGFKVKEEQLLEDLQGILLLNTNEVVLEFEETKPQYTKESFDEMTRIGYYESYYNINSTNRNLNLAQASSKINNVVLYPGDEFSTNALYGPTTIENGYAVANVIVDNQLVEGVGGGVCQISSTLYNAVLRAELEVTQRRNHSLTVSYMPLGFDATLANPYIDFKFKNDLDAPVLVTAWIENGTASVAIFGKEIHNEGRTLKFFSETESVQKAEIKTEEDDTLFVGEKVMDITPIDGLVVHSYKSIYEDGKLVDTVYLAKSNYARRDGVEKVGTKPNPDAIPTPVPTPVPETEIKEPEVTTDTMTNATVQSPETTETPESNTSDQAVSIQ